MPKPAFSTVGNTSIATDRLASARAKPTLAKNSASVDCTSTSISGPDAARHGGTVQEVANTTTRRTGQLTRQTPRLFGDTLTDQGPFHIRRRAAETIARTAGISRTRNTTSEELSNQCLNGIDDRPSNQAEYDYNKSHHAPDEARMYQVHTR